MLNVFDTWKKFLIKENLINNNEIREGIDPATGKPNHKYYAFDWDDNLMFMPTKIIVVDTNGEEFGISTEEFAHYRMDIGKKPINHNGKIIEGYAKEPFRNFRTQGDKQFLVDCKTAPLGPAWPDFVECINEGSYFAIITARGHSPLTLEQAVKDLIDEGRRGLRKQSLIDSLRKYEEIVNQNSSLSDEDLLVKYFENCQFSPVSYTGPGSKTSGDASSPEDAKIQAMNSFIANLEVINDGEPIKVGFSDDDIRNVEAMIKNFNEKEGLSISIFHTTTEGKIKQNVPDEQQNVEVPPLKEGLATKMFRNKTFRNK